MATVLILGAAGMLGRKVTERLLADRVIGGENVERLVLQDVVPPSAPNHRDIEIEVRCSDLSRSGEAEKLIAARPNYIIHLAAVVSGEAEADFEKGYTINLDGTRSLFEAIRQAGDSYRPRLVFTSSAAVFGAPYPEIIEDDFLAAPLTSYGTQKAMCELLLSDYTRRGFFEGVGIRLPTICVRPGAPNKAASGFFSNIIREPLAGNDAILPVSADVRHCFASPRSAVGFVMRAAAIESEMIGVRRNLSMPSLSATVEQQIESLRRIAGERVAARIRVQPDPSIQRIVAGWPQRFNANRACKLGFTAESSFDEIIRAHIDDELNGEFVR
ncbi:MAG: D-erythronate dehydrogenase [Bdellovibrionota bacterium]